MDEELREQISDILDDFGHEVVNQAYDSRFSLLGKHEHKLMQLIKARDAAIRIDEDENWLRFVGAAWDAEPVTANDLHKRIKELRRESDPSHD